MPGPVLHAGAQVSCAHQGQATPTAVNPRVRLSGQPVVTAGPYGVIGCVFPPPPAANGPCVTGVIASVATRVMAGGQPVLLLGAPGVCAPTGTPLIALLPGARVVAI